MKVVVKNAFSPTTIKFEKATMRAVDRASRKGAAAVRTAPTRYRIRGILAKTRPLTPRRRGNTIYAGFYNPDFRELFMEYGTLKRRRKPLKRPRIRKVKRGGIHPQYSMRRGRQVATAALPDLVRAELGKVR